MKFLGLGSPSETGTALEFGCPCSAGVFLAVNSGEAMLVKAMGVKLGPAEGPPFELAQMAAGAPAESLPVGKDITWSQPAWDRAQRIPETVRHMVIRSVTSFAQGNGHREITEAVLDEFKTSKGYMGG